MALLAVVADLGAAMAAVKSSQLLCLQEGCEERSLFSCMTLLGMEYSITIKTISCRENCQVCGMLLYAWNPEGVMLELFQQSAFFVIQTLNGTSNYQGSHPSNRIPN